MMTAESVRDGFLSLITADLYVIIAAVFGICFALKRAAFFPDRFIPLAAIVIGGVFELSLFFFYGGNPVESIAKGIVAGMAAVYAANVIKQLGGDKK